MSIQVPSWLSHLRRDSRGLPVPFVNRWGGEDVSRLSVEHDPVVGRMAVFLRDFDEPEPDFTRQNFQRQRLCVLDMRCQVCGEHLDQGATCLVVGSNSVEWIDLKGRQVPVVNEPWLHRRCALYAVTFCPALIRRRREDDLRIHTIDSQEDFTIVLSTGYVDGPLEELSREVQPVMWAKIALHNLRIVGAGDEL